MEARKKHEREGERVRRVVKRQERKRDGKRSRGKSFLSPLGRQRKEESTRKDDGKRES